MKLPFQKDRELRSSLYRILGFYPHHLPLYRQALMHKSLMHRNKKGKAVNNERLEFLGDAILSAIVGDIVYEHFPGKREGFLTNTRSKLVQRETLNKLSSEIGINRLIFSNGHSSSHNSYVGGNAFEALVGAIYLDRGYDACMRFMKKRILSNMVNIDKVARKEVNFKSRLLEWSQKNRIQLAYNMLESTLDEDGSPMFEFQVVLEGIACEKGKGYSKKESQQKASQLTLEKIRRDHRFLDTVYAAKQQRLDNEKPIEEKPESEVEKVVEAAVENKVETPTEKPKKTAKRTTRKSTKKTEEKPEEKPIEEKKPKRTTRSKVKKESETVEKKVETVEKPAEEPTEPSAEEPKKKPRQRSTRSKKKTEETLEAQPKPDTPPVEAKPEAPDEFDLSDITHRELSREEIIAAAEEAAFSNEA